MGKRVEKTTLFLCANKYFSECYYAMKAIYRTCHSFPN